MSGIHTNFDGTFSWLTPAYSSGDHESRSSLHVCITNKTGSTSGVFRILVRGQRLSAEGARVEMPYRPGGSVGAGGGLYLPLGLGLGVVSIPINCLNFLNKNSVF